MGQLTQIKIQLVKPTLIRMGLYSESALNLVTGIGLVESGYRTKTQTGGGPALGYWQMEPVTERDCWNNFLNYRPLLAGLIKKMIYPDTPSTKMLVVSDEYAAAMCRVKLYRSPRPLPSYNDAEGMSQFHKDVYNTSLGKADPEQNVPLFRKAIEA